MPVEVHTVEVESFAARTSSTRTMFRSSGHPSKDGGGWSVRLV